MQDSSKDKGAPRRSRRHTVHSVTFALLRDLGARTIFGNPGSTELGFLTDFPADFRYVLGLHEASVVGMAHGWTIGANSPAVVNLHTGPGVANAAGAIVTAFEGRAPLLLIAGQEARRHLDDEPFLAAQVSELLRPYLKWSRQPASAHAVPAAIRRAYHLAHQPPRGPALVVVPSDDWEMPAAPLPGRAVLNAAPLSAVQADEVAGLIAGSSRPLIVAGAGVDRARAWAPLVALAERLGASVMSEPLGSRAGFPEDHSLFAGHLAPSRPAMRAALKGHDTVLVVGAPVFRAFDAAVGDPIPPGVSLLQLTDDPTEAARAMDGRSLVADLRESLEAIVSRLAPTDPPRPPTRPAASRPGDPVALTPSAAFRTLAELLPEDAIVVEESPSNADRLRELVPVRTAAGFASAANGGLGFGLPAAVGLALACPRRRVVCVIGDGSTMYAPQALWSAARERAAITVLVVNNGGYQILRDLGRPLPGADRIPGLDIDDLDIPSLAGAMGCASTTVTETDGLRAALRTALSADRPHLIEAVMRREGT